MSFSENKITENTLDNQTKDAICQGKLFDLQPIGNKRVEVSFTARVSLITYFSCSENGQIIHDRLWFSVINLL